MNDVIIIGSGPAGLTASLYASRYQLTNLVIGGLLGGTITYAHKVDNFPGVSGLSGLELSQRMVAQVKALGTEIVGDNVVSVVKENENFKVVTQSQKEFSSKTIILTTGTERRKLDIPGEEQFLGKGVSYCTTCDAPFFKDKTVVLVGGSNAACSGAIHLAKFAQKIYLIYRKAALRAEPVWVGEVKNNPKIEVIYETNLTQILGSDHVEKVTLDKPFNGQNEISAQGVFVEIGGVPSSLLADQLGVEKDNDGYIKVTPSMQTTIRGVFAAGDVTDQSIILSQAITACAQGAIAANSAFEYLKS